MNSDTAYGIILSLIVGLVLFACVGLGTAIEDHSVLSCVEQRTTFAKSASDSVAAYRACLPHPSAK